MPSLLRTSKGHNLLEVVIAVFMFLTVLVLITTLWVQHNMVLAKSRNQLVATALARSVLENVTAEGYAALTPSLGTPLVTEFSARSQIRGRLANTRFTISQLATQSPITPDFRRVVVTVSWKESGDDQEKVLEYETSLFRTQ